MTAFSEYLTAANVLTAVRIVLSPVLFALPYPSAAFYFVYSVCGVSDMTDGLLARRTTGESSFGARLDSIADLLFSATALISVLPALCLPLWVWLWIGGIALLRGFNALYSRYTLGKIQFLHSTLNRITGLSLFAVPFVITYLPTQMIAISVGSVASAAAVHELLCLRQAAKEREL